MLADKGVTSVNSKIYLTFYVPMANRYNPLYTKLQVSFTHNLRQKSYEITAQNNLDDKLNTKMLLKKWKLYNDCYVCWSIATNKNKNSLCMFGKPDTVDVCFISKSHTTFQLIYDFL